MRNFTRGFVALSCLAFFVIGFALVSRIVALWPMYTSLETRSQMQWILEDAKTRHGLSLSYAVPTRARCQMEYCWMMLREPFNLPIDPAVRHVVYIQWPRDDANAYRYDEGME
jgi:hypothetical protein